MSYSSLPETYTPIFEYKDRSRIYYIMGRLLFSHMAMSAGPSFFLFDLLDIPGNEYDYIYEVGVKGCYKILYKWDNDYKIWRKVRGLE